MGRVFRWAEDLDPTEVEAKVIACANHGVMADCRQNIANPNDIQLGDVRADVLVALALRLREDWPVYAHGIEIAYANVTGAFDLFGLHNPLGGPAALPFLFRRCQFKEPIVLDHSRLSSLQFEDCEFFKPSSNQNVIISAKAVSIDGPLSLEGSRMNAEGVGTFGTVDLTDARIAGPAHFNALAGHWAFLAQGLHVDGRLDFSDCDAAGAANAVARRRRRDRLPDNLRDPDFQTSISANLRNLNVAGDFSASGSSFKARTPLNGAALDLSNGTVAGTIHLDTSKNKAIKIENWDIKTEDLFFHSAGRIRLNGTRIGGKLIIVSTKITSKEDYTIDARSVEIRQNIRIGPDSKELDKIQNMKIDGGLNLSSATIDGQLEIQNISITHSKKPECEFAINLDTARVAKDVILCSDIVDGNDSAGLEVVGEFSMAGAMIGGSLALRGGLFISKASNVRINSPQAKVDDISNYCIYASSVRITNDIIVRSGAKYQNFNSFGEININGATIDGEIDVRGGQFINPGGDTIDGELAHIKGGVRLRSTSLERLSSFGRLKFSSARLGGFRCRGANLLGNPQALDLFNAEVDGPIRLTNFFENRRPANEETGRMHSPGASTHSDGGGAHVGAQPDKHSHDPPVSLPGLCIGVVSLKSLKRAVELDFRGSAFFPRVSLHKSDEPLANKKRFGHRTIDVFGARIDGDVRFGAPINGKGDDLPTLIFGAIDLDDTKIGGRIDLTGAVFRNFPCDEATALQRYQSRSYATKVDYEKVGVCLSLQGAQVEGAYECSEFGPLRTRKKSIEIFYSIIKTIEKNVLVDEYKKSIKNELFKWGRSIYKNLFNVDDNDRRSQTSSRESFVHPNGLFDLRDATIGRLLDEPEDGWPLRRGFYDLDGCIYHSISIQAETDDSSHRSRVQKVITSAFRLIKRDKIGSHKIHDRRLKWLENQFSSTPSRVQEFKPQPYERLARILREMGHSYDADRIAIQKRKLAARCNAEGATVRHFQFILRHTSDYGYSQFRSLMFCIGGIFFGTIFYYFGMEYKIVFVEKQIEQEHIESVPNSYLIQVDAANRTMTPRPISGIKAPAPTTISAEASLHSEPPGKSADANGALDFDQWLSAFGLAFDGFVPFLELGITSQVEKIASPWARLAEILYKSVGLILTSITVVTFTGLLRRD